MPRSKKSDPSSASATPAATVAEELTRSSRYSSSLVAGLAILDLFSAERTELGIATLADQLHMSRSTTHRYASTLVALGYLEQDYSRRYRLAPRVADLGMALLESMPLRRHAREGLLRLREQTGRTVSLAILDGAQLRYLERLRGWRRGQHAVDLDRGVAARSPIHCTALGKVLLAYLPDGEREQLAAKLTLERYGPNSITTKKGLHAELATVLEAGYAIGDEELAAGVRSIAVPLLDKHDVAIAAIGIPVPSEAFTRAQLVEAFEPALKATAARISASLQFED